MKFKSFDGKELHIHEWADVEKVRGVVQIVHGMAEHGARYGQFAQFLNSRGYAVFADDHRGHGLTDPATPGWSDCDMFADVVRDEAAISDWLRGRYPGVKLCVFGFSFGSFVTQSFISKYPDKADAAIIGGSSHKKDFDVYLGTAVAAVLPERKPAKIIERLSFGAYAKQFPDGQWVSADEANNKAYADDPYCGFTCSARFYRDFFRGLRRLYTPEYISGLRRDMPLLLASGAQDAVGNMGVGVKKLRDFYVNKAGMTDVTVKLFENSRHEFLNERRDRDVKWGAVAEFLDGKL